MLGFQATCKAVGNIELLMQPTHLLLWRLCALVVSSCDFFTGRARPTRAASLRNTFPLPNCILPCKFP